MNSTETDQIHSSWNIFQCPEAAGLIEKWNSFLKSQLQCDVHENIFRAMKIFLEGISSMQCCLCDRQGGPRTHGMNYRRLPFTDTQQTISKSFDSFSWDFKTHRSGVTNFREIYHFNRKHHDFIKHEVKNDNYSPWHPQMWETKGRMMVLTVVPSVGGGGSWE